MERKSNIELLRIVAMLLVVLVHANYFSLGGIVLEDITKSPLNSFCKAFAEQSCIICVNVFILISGWFGIRPNIKGVLSLLFQVFFFHIFIVVTLFLAGESVPLSVIAKGFYFGYQYWFIASYLVLYSISPILNAFIESATPRMFLSVLITFFFLEFALGWIIGAAAFQLGYSTLSFIGLYLLAQFIRNHYRKLLNIGIYMNLLMYILFSIFPVILFFITKHEFNILAYSSPFVISASVFFFLAFNRMNISSKTINYLACSSLSIYLVHLHPLIINHFKNFMNYAYDCLGGYGYVLFAIIFAVCFGLSCILLDKLRIYLWNISYKVFINGLIVKLMNLFNKLYSHMNLN